MRNVYICKVIHWSRLPQERKIDLFTHVFMHTLSQAFKCWKKIVKKVNWALPS